MVQESPWKNIFNCLLIVLRAEKKLAAVILITNYQVAVILINVIKSSVDGPSNTCTSKQALKIYNIWIRLLTENTLLKFSLVQPFLSMEEH